MNQILHHVHDYAHVNEYQTLHHDDHVRAHDYVRESDHDHHLEDKHYTIYDDEREVIVTFVSIPRHHIEHTNLHDETIQTRTFLAYVHDPQHPIHRPIQR